jgi:hypothetical protein
MTNFCVRKLDNKFYVSFRNNQIYVYNNDGIIFNFPEEFYSINSDISFDFRIDSTAKANLMEVPDRYSPSRMLYDTEKFLAPTILTDAQIIARGQNPLGWKQTYSFVELTISYKINNKVQKYGPHNVEARVKGYGSFLPYNRKMPLRVKSTSSIGGLGTATDLTINNMIQSGAKITEHIIYKIYRDYGMLAPRTNFIRVFINDSTTKIISVTNNTITTNNNHYLFPGMRVKFVGLGNISNDSIFYVISSDRTDTSFKISETLNGTEYTLSDLSSVNIEFYTDYGEYINVENLKNLYKINEFFGTNNTTGLYELGVTTTNQELNVPSSDLYYSREYGSSRSNINNFLTALASTSNWYTNFSNYANINQFIKFAVIELLLGQMDGYNTFLNNSYLAADNNNKFHVIPWGADSYCSEDALNALAWFAYGRFLQQCWANNTTLTQFATELVAFNNWLKNDSNIINYINTIFDQKIDTFNSDMKQPSSTTSSTITTGKNNLINFIQDSDDRVDYFLSRPRPVTNLTGQLVNGNFVMNWDPVTTNVSGQSIANITYEIIFLASIDHKYRYGGYSSSNTSHGMSTNNTTYTVSSGNMDSLYTILQSEMSDIPNLFGGLYFSVVPKGVNDLWGFAAQPILARSSAVTPPVDTPYVPTMKIGITEVMSNSTAKYGLSSAPDWFEITNFDTSGINISGWKMDDDSKSINYAVSIIPSGWTSLGSGESAVFIETNNPAVAIPAFRQFWSLPSTTKIGYYSGSAVSFSSNGDGTHLFVPSGSSQNSWIYFTGVSFGQAITNRSFYWEYNNNNIVNTGYSTPNYKGAYVGSGGSPIAYATGSPGIYSKGSIPPIDIDCSTGWNPSLNCIPLTGLDIPSAALTGCLINLSDMPSSPPSAGDNLSLYISKFINITISNHPYYPELNRSYSFSGTRIDPPVDGVSLFYTPIDDSPWGLTFGVSSTSNASSSVMYLSLSDTVQDGRVGPLPAELTSINIPIKTRYRRAYNDYTIADSYTVIMCAGDTETENGTCENQPNSSAFPPSCDSGSDLYSLAIKFLDTCRVVTPSLSNCTEYTNPCRNIIDVSTLNSYQLPRDSGRPIDIDVSVCPSYSIRPDSSAFAAFNPTGYVLYFQPKNLGAVPVINDVIYDTTTLNASTDIVRLYAGTGVDATREWACKYLKYATVKNLDTVINGATPEIKVTGLVYNWPYNDLYWNSRCSTTPVGEIPINLVPC